MWYMSRAPKSLFRYSGNKSRLTRFLEEPPRECGRLVEPFLGSGGYTLTYGLPGLGCDLDGRVTALWEWLRRCDPQDLYDLDAWWRENRKRELMPNVSEVREKFGEGASLYFKINVCSAMVGQWSSETGYPQHDFPLQKTIGALESARRVEVFNGDWREVGPHLRAGDCVLLAPPYIGTHGNYKGEGGFSTEGIASEILSWGVPVIFTYGEGAAEIFPEFEWEIATVRRVPNLRRGGSVERREWVAYIRFPRSETVFDFFRAD